jgi:hypothetical protein
MLEILEPLFADVRRGVFEVRQGIGDYINQTGCSQANFPDSDNRSLYCCSKTFQLRNV